MKRPIPRSEPKPCPRCYAPMTKTPAGFACERHGVPEPPKAPVPLVRQQSVAKRSVTKERVAKKRAPRPPRQPREPIPRKPIIRWGEVRYPSDLKPYPLPPSPDGRANDRTSPESPTTARSRLTPALMARAIEMSKAGQSPWTIAGELWQEAGYKDRYACRGSIYRALRAAKVLDTERRATQPVATPVESVSTEPEGDPQ